MLRLTGLILGVLFLHGCAGIGGFWMTGNPYITPSTPELLLWKNPAATPEQRRQASADCGGQASDRNPTPYNQDKLEKMRQEGEELWQTDERNAYNWQQCMLDNGYSYTGRCYDNDASRGQPKCKDHKLWPMSEWRPD